MRLKWDACTLHQDGPGVYHVKPIGSATYTATMKRFRHNPMHRKWGVRPFNSPNATWTWRQTMEEGVMVAMSEYAPAAST